MNTEILEAKHKEITAFCRANADEAVVQKYAKYFKEGYDGYGIDTKVFVSKAEEWMDSWKAEMRLDDYLDLGDRLLSTGKFEEAGFAIHFVASRKDEFSADTFDRLGRWLETGISNWANTDVLCMQVLSAFLFEGVLQPADFISWTASGSKWKRRAVPVTFVETIKKGHAVEPVLAVIDGLMEDPEEDVQKGIGTLLREIWKRQPADAEAFLLKWKDRCGRKIIHYATEKMDKESRLKFRKAK